MTSRPRLPDVSGQVRSRAQDRPDIDKILKEINATEPPTSSPAPPRPASPWSLLLCPLGVEGDGKRTGPAGCLDLYGRLHPTGSQTEPSSAAHDQPASQPEWGLRPWGTHQTAPDSLYKNRAFGPILRQAVVGRTEV